MAGRPYSTQSLELVFNLVNLANDVKLVEWKKVKNDETIEPPDDPDGSETLTYLKKVKKIIDIIIIGKESYSLGLSPVVYFYSLEGRYQITPFMAFIELIKMWES